MTQVNTLARYEVLRELGRGAITAVYAARDRSTGGLVALKTLDPALSNQADANFVDRFLKHARSAQRLSHRNIVKVHDAGEADGIVHVAMEMLEGESLRKILDDGPLPIARAIQIAHDIARGLAHAHLEGVVHGGLSPSNIIVLRSNVVKITDFGIGQLGEAAGRSAPRVGSLGYRSPEQVRGDPVDHRCDIFSLGALFYEMLTHRAPFGGSSPDEITKNILHAEPPLASELNQHVPPVLDKIVFTMLARQPDDRMSGAPILQHDLQQLVDGLGLGPGASAGSDEPAAGVPPAGSETRLRAPEEIQVRNRTTDGEAFDHRQAMLMMERESRLRQSSAPQPAIFAALALVLAVLAVGLSGFMYYSASHGERGVAASRMQEAPASAPAVSRPAAPAPVAEATKEPATERSPTERSPTERSPLVQAESLAPELPRERQPITEDPRPPGGTARLIVAVAPRGEVYIDGEYHGTTPPITTFDLEPGMHRIEVRSASRKPYLTYMTVQAGDVRRIRRDFNARPSRPPG